MSRFSNDKVLRAALIEKYMDVAKSFYFEGSSEEDEREEFAPKFADEMTKLFDDSLNRTTNHLKGYDDNASQDLYEDIGLAVGKYIKEISKKQKGGPDAASDKPTN